MKIKLSSYLSIAIVGSVLIFGSCEKTTVETVSLNTKTENLNGQKTSWYTPIIVTNNVPRVRGIHVGTDSYGYLDPAVYNNPDITAINLYCYWRYLNPAYNVYDWVRLDSELTQYTAKGKNIGLVLAAGGRSPNWIYNQGVRHFTMVQTHGGSGTSFIKEQPVVFDSAYVSLFTKFIDALSAHMKTQPYWDKLTHVAINGINRTTAELRLPSENGLNGNSNDVASWNAVGYTPEKVISAFKQIMKVVANDFPYRVLDVPYIQNQENAFPAIGKNNIGIKCFLWMKQKYPTRVVARYTVVTPTFVPHGFSVDLTNNGIDFTSEIDETTLSLTKSSKDLSDAIQAGINANTMYVELFPDNVTRFPNVMANYAQLVFKH